MRCAHCKEKIEDEPFWKNEKPYCSEECADLDEGEKEEEEEESEEEEEDEEEEK